MATINEKLDDLLGASKRQNANKTSSQREIGPSQAKSTGNKFADAMIREEKRLSDRRKNMDKNIAPDFSRKVDVDYPEHQDELEALYNSAKKDNMGLPAGARTNKKGGMIKKMAKGGTASSRADGCCTKGKTKGRMI